MRDRGLTTFQFHVHNPADQPSAHALSEVQAGAAGIAAAPGVGAQTPEAIAQAYLEQALQSPAMPAFTTPTLVATDGSSSAATFEPWGRERLPFTNGTLVNFRQAFHGIPVYGANVCVELDDSNHLMSISSSLGQPTANPNPAHTLEEAQAKMRDHAGVQAILSDEPPYLAFYSSTDGQWHLVYVFEDVQPEANSLSSQEALQAVHPVDPGHSLPHPVPLCFDYLIDAHTNALIAELPRTATTGGMHTARDELGVERTFWTSQNGPSRYMYDPHYNVHTYDANFANLAVGALPNTYCVNPPDWTPAAVSAHANAREVAAFLNTVLQRNGVDNRGGRLVSHVNCVDGRYDPKVWPNAAWYRNQMVYGQQYDATGNLRSYAASLDVVAHEVFHGVTSYTARLQYLGETGALNESYSDIFGILVSNAHQRNRAAWNWQLGEELSGGVPLRDLSAPRKFRQPDHMWDYVHLPLTPAGDYGGVHVNSGIHNKAAYLIMTAVDQNGEPLLSAAQLAQLFYTALLSGLNRTSRFRDSREALAQAAYSLFARQTPNLAEATVAAIRHAFTEVGVSEPPSAMQATPTAAVAAPGTAQAALPGVAVQSVVAEWNTVTNRGAVHLLVNGQWMGRASSTVEEFAALTAIAQLPQLRLAGGTLYGHR